MLRTFGHAPREDTKNFHIRTLPIGQVRSISYFKSLGPLLRDLQPDIIYPMYPEYDSFTTQFALLRNIYARKAKMAFFTINNWDIYTNKLIYRMFWWIVKKYADVAFCHSSEMKCVLRRGGFQQPIYIQTNVGVDETRFTHDESARKAIRSRYGPEWFCRWILRAYRSA